jgi:hypothetical protein
MNGTSLVSVIIVKFREMRQRERRPERQLLDNSKPALAQPSKAVGYRREREELLMLRDPGGPCISCPKYNLEKPRAQRHPRVLAPSYHATHVEHRTSSRNLDAACAPMRTASPLALLLQVLRLNPHRQVM